MNILAVSKIENLPKGIIEKLNVQLVENDEEPISSFDELLEYIIDVGDKYTEHDTNYISTFWWIQVGDWKLQTFGDQYIKDHSICDMEYYDHIDVEKIPANTEEKKEENRQKWVKLFNENESVKVLEILIDTPFPDSVNL